MNNQTVFTEMFPVRVENLPELYAYQSTDTAINLSRLARRLQGNWAVADELLLTDALPKKLNVDPEAATLKKVNRYIPSPIARTEFLIQVIIPPLADSFAQALQTPLQGNFRVLQEPVFKAWDVGGKPTLSIGIVQRLIHKQDLATYAATIPNPQGLIGMTVISRAPWIDGKLLNGVIVSITGTLGNHRSTLARFARTNDATKRLERAPDTEPVVKVRTFFGDYDYAASGLFIALGAKDYTRLRVNAPDANKASYQNIIERAKAVGAASGVLKALDIIGDGYNADNTHGRFVSAADLNFSAQIMLGDGQPRPYSPRTLWTEIKQHGMFDAVPQSRPVRIGIINALGETPPNNFESQLIAAINALGVEIGNVQHVITPGMSSTEVSTAYQQLNDPDVMIAYMPGGEPGQYSPDIDWEPFLNVKRVAFAANLLSLCLSEKDMSGKLAPQEWSLAFALSVGHVPFALGVPLPFTDQIVGFTVVRGETPTYVSTVYHNNGVLIGYIIHTGPLHADGVAKLFPDTFFAKQRVVMHFTDNLTDKEYATLAERAAAIGMTLHFCEVGAGANPRLYMFTGKGVGQPPTGTGFKLADTKALLIPALPVHPAAPPNPLLIDTDEQLPVVEGLRSILAMNTLHPTARKPRLPITLHYGARIKRLMGAGVRPLLDEGMLAWWL